EQLLLASGKTLSESLLGAAEEYAIECAILKVFGSEVLDYIVDEGVQVHGGNGYSDEYPISKAYRDSRINRIYEGTNEINRLLIVDMVLKRAMKGKLDLMGPAMSVQQELMSIPDFGTEDKGVYAKEKQAVANFKKCILMVAGAAVQKLMMTLNKEQEILMNIADMSIIAYHAESALLRLEKLTVMKGEAAASVQADMVRTYIYDAADAINKAGKDAINSFAQGDELRMMNIGLKRFTKVDAFNSKEARRRICAQLVADNGYKL
ncbi:MAG: acyl-CoA dehydrogenase family protein, partial [Bacteroidetes bacterium]|nr:acyl-CoA dehydrogenase family protein [Bacteroidota bacterium]